MKKKVMFMVINMNVGGTEKALLNMIEELPWNQYDITVLLLEETGGFMKAIPDHVHVDTLTHYGYIKDMFKNPPLQTSLKLLQAGKLVQALSIFFLHGLSKLRQEKSLFYKYILKDIPHHEEEYDLAVAYAGPMDLISYFIAHKVKAEKKVQWIHFDVDMIGFNPKFACKTYLHFDRILAVSHKGKDKLVKKLPSLVKRIDVTPNIISSELIKKQALEGKGFRDNFKGIRILTVGRLSNEKGQDLAIKALKMLVDEGFDVKWYCAGEGPARDTYEQMVNRFKLKKRFVFLGEVLNPYQYIMHCDIYVQPSRHEGYCITLAEAKALNKPIVTTAFTGSSEQIINNVTGLIVNIDEQSMYRAVKELISDNETKNMFSDNLIKQSLDTPATEKILKFI